jgi:hypothetical protein
MKNTIIDYDLMGMSGGPAQRLCRGGGEKNFNIFELGYSTRQKISPGTVPGRKLPGAVPSLATVPGFATSRAKGKKMPRVTRMPYPDLHISIEEKRKYLV